MSAALPGLAVVLVLAAWSSTGLAGEPPQPSSVADRWKRISQANHLNADLGELYRQGRFQEAIPVALQVLAIRKEVLGDKHALYAQSLNNLAMVYHTLGDYAQAEPLYQQALALRKEVLGDKHSAYATSLNNLGMLYQAQGDYARAEPLLRQALAITKGTSGEKNRDYAQSLANLAGVYQAQGDYARAESLFQQALALRKQVLREKHPDYAENLDNLAVLYQMQGDYARAEPLFQQALALRKEALGDKHPAYAVSLHNLALVYQAQGGYARAEPLFQQALALRKEAVGDRHPSCALMLNNLAMLYWAQGDYARAERFLRQGLDIARDSLDLAAATQSERRQLAMASRLHDVLDCHLALAPQAKGAVEDVYAPVLAWKGAVLARQSRLRLQRKHPDLADDFAQLDRVTGRLAALALAVPDPRQQAAYRQQIQELTEQKEQLESDLARNSAAFRQERQAQRLTPAGLQKALPADAALVDFLEYTHPSPPRQGKGPWQMERHLAAFVVRPDSIRQLDLGPVQPIAEAIDRWRQTTLRTRPSSGADDPAGELRRRLWQPLEPHLQRARLVLVSPDGVVARLPLAALPGSKPDSYLLEEVSLAVVPVPQLLPELLAARQADPEPKPSLLLVGDVDFGAAPGLADARGTSRSAARGRGAGALPAADRLPFTREEIALVRESFQRRFPRGTVTMLCEDRATEAAVRQQAPRHRWLHLATHGFFAPPQLRSALAPTRERGAGGPGLSEAGSDAFGWQGISGFHPGLLSGLVLAGANRPAQPGADDGILTALEVAEQDLSGVELATLSACETGLGEAAGGEGLLGLQRAFQAAGARAVLASLWQVDDEATRKLMVRFYDNLWRTKEPLGKLAALREAQLWMLREGVQRGLVRRGLKRRTEGEESAGPARTPPYYWAAFVLSGDWR
jgi:CHAT domain-containing protein/Flp pilus assembly protein TadD